MKIALCDDDTKEIEKYKGLLGQLSTMYQIPITVSDFCDGQQLLFHALEKKEAPDVVFIDIHMPGDDGITVAKKLKEKQYLGEIVFLTVSKEHFLPAFDVRAFNYIVKGEGDEERFEHVLLDVAEKVRESNEDYLMLTSCGETAVIPIGRIVYIECINRILYVFYDDKVFEFYSTLGKVAEDLLGKGFVRIHRSYVVALPSVEKIQSKQVVLKNGKILPIGATYLNGFKTLYARYFQRGGVF